MSFPDFPRTFLSLVQNAGISILARNIILTAVAVIALLLVQRAAQRLLQRQNIELDDRYRLVITFDSHWERAKALLGEIADRQVGQLSQDAEEKLRQAASKFLVAGNAVTPRVFTRVLDRGIELCLRFVSEVRQPRFLEEAIWEDVLRAFAAEPDIHFAPMQRVVLQDQDHAGG